MVLCILAVILIVLAFCTLCAITVGSRYDKQNGLDSGDDTCDV